MRKTSRHRSESQKIHHRRKDIKKVDNTKDIDDILAKGKIVQDLLGFSREKITHLFERAIVYLQVGHFDEAVSSFSLLTRLNPYIADFWLGLAIAQMRQGEHTRAFEAFGMAIAMDPSRFDIYSYAIECCLEMQNPNQADALLNDAVTYAKRHKSSEDADIILRSANALREKIASYKT